MKIEIICELDGLIIGSTEKCPLLESFKANYGKSSACFVNANYKNGGVKNLKKCCHYAQDSLSGEPDNYSINCTFK